ncbi:hypothetical protein [Cupriavidus gilardii]|uniref:hypothetical protein n=2 Tax=Cupriavidus gilardii TaxID=82541 RepID=UPI001EE5741C|nr:hypothetical protein [Cupriavidus gilardii]MCG5259426.1 hypothetical protein [Cupriavidus gilardii]
MEPSEAVYRYQADHVVSKAAANAPTDVRGGTPLVIGAFRFRDGGLVRITMEKGAVIRATRLETPRFASAWQRLQYCLRSLFGLEGGRRWTVKPVHEREIANAACHLTMARRQPAHPAPPSAPPSAPSPTPSTAPTASAASTTESPPLPLVRTLTQVLPFLEPPDRLRAMSICREAYRVTEGERLPAHLLVRAQGVHTRSALRTALSDAARWHEAGKLSHREYAELLAALATRVACLPPGQRVTGFGDMLEALSAARTLRKWASMPLIALAGVLRDKEGLRQVGAALTDRLCVLIDRLATALPQSATPDERLGIWLPLMQHPASVPAVARRAWCKLVPDPSAWPDAIAHLDPARQQALVPTLIAAAMAIRSKTGERNGVMEEIDSQWLAMVGAALDLDDRHPVKGAGLAALARHSRRAERKIDAAGLSRDMPPVEQVWDELFEAAKQADAASAAELVLRLIDRLGDFPPPLVRRRWLSLWHWVKSNEHVPDMLRRIELQMAMHRPVFATEPIRVELWCRLWDEWRHGPEASDMQVGAALMEAVVQLDNWCGPLVADKLTTAAYGLSARQQAHLLEAVCTQARLHDATALRVVALDLARIHGQPGPLLSLCRLDRSLFDEVSGVALSALKTLPRPEQARHLEMLLRADCLPTLPGIWAEAARDLTSSGELPRPQWAALARELVRWYARQCAYGAMQPAHVHGVVELLDRPDAGREPDLLAAIASLADAMATRGTSWEPTSADRSAAGTLAGTLFRGVWDRIGSAPGPLRNAVLDALVRDEGARQRKPMYWLTVQFIVDHAQRSPAQRPRLLARLASSVGRHAFDVGQGPPAGPLGPHREIVWRAIHALADDQLARPLDKVIPWFKRGWVWGAKAGHRQAQWTGLLEQLDKLRGRLPDADKPLFSGP